MPMSFGRTLEKHLRLRRTKLFAEAIAREGARVPAEPGFDPANIKAHLTAIEIGTKIRQMMKK